LKFSCFGSPFPGYRGTCVNKSNKLVRKRENIPMLLCNQEILTGGINPGQQRKRKDDTRQKSTRVHTRGLRR
jgi:hypothetical protein